MSINVGDWVVIRDHVEGAGTVGFVTKSDALDKTFFVEFVTYGLERKPCRKYGWIDDKNIKLYNPPQAKEDLKALIDLALTTNDKVWFDEITNKILEGQTNEL